MNENDLGIVIWSENGREIAFEGDISMSGARDRAKTLFSIYPQGVAVDLCRGRTPQEGEVIERFEREDLL